MSDRNVALVAGGNGIIGKALIEHLQTLPDWTARSIARRPYAHIPSVTADLDDPIATREALKSCGEITHLFYAALSPQPSLAEEDAVNGAMLRNLLDGLAAAGAQLSRTVLYQGAKIYGVHIGPVPSPFYEDDNPRHLGPNFYQTQEAELVDRQSTGGGDWSILRPDVVIGDAAGNAMNIATVIGAYAAICRATGAAFRFPGTEGVYRRVFAQMTDARALARASIWAATADAARNEAFNYVHEPFRWERIWTKVAGALGLELGPPLPMTLASHMADKAAIWDRLAREQGLNLASYDQAVGWGFGDFVFKSEFDVLSDMGKIRRAGFSETVLTELALVEAILRQRRDKILPV